MTIMDKPPQTFDEACEWFEKGLIDFDTLRAALETMPPPPPEPRPDDPAERRIQVDSEIMSHHDLDCLEPLYFDKLIDFEQLCQLWDAAKRNPQAEPPGQTPPG